MSKILYCVHWLPNSFIVNLIIFCFNYSNIFPMNYVQILQNYNVNSYKSKMHLYIVRQIEFQVLN